MNNVEQQLAALAWGAGVAVAWTGIVVLLTVSKVRGIIRDVRGGCPQDKGE